MNVSCNCSRSNYSKKKLSRPNMHAPAQDHLDGSRTQSRIPHQAGANRGHRVTTPAGGWWHIREGGRCYHRWAGGGAMGAALGRGCWRTAVAGFGRNSCYSLRHRTTWTSTLRCSKPVVSSWRSCGRCWVMPASSMCLGFRCHIKCDRPILLNFDEDWCGDVIILISRTSCMPMISQLRS
jgi:hypothetical protein